MKNYRYTVGGLLVAAGMINYLDRATLGVVAPLVSKDLDLSKTQMGAVFSAFFVGYALFAFIGGSLADRFGPRRVLSWAMGIWSLLCAATAAATGYGSLLLARLLFGCGEGPQLSTMNRAVTSWFPKRETATMIGFAFAGQNLGNVIAGPLVAMIAVSFGWKAAFVAVGAVGFVWLFVWRLLFVDRPDQSRHVAPAELELVRTDRDAPEPSGETAWSHLFRPATLALGAGLFAGNYTLYVFISWLPSYLIDTFSFDLKQAGFLAAIPWIAGSLGYVGGGAVSDWLYSRSSRRFLVRKLFTILPLLASALFLIALSRASAPVIAISLVALATFTMSASLQSVWATMHEIFPRRLMGSVGGFIHLISNTSGIVGPLIMGAAVQHFGGYGNGFLVSAGVDIAGVLALIAFIRPKHA